MSSTTKPVHIQDGPPSDVEEIKIESDYLRGSLIETMNDSISAGIPGDDNRLMKFHGSYLQDDRDLRTERQRQKLEPAYQFMIRVRTPAGFATPKQWLVMDELAHKYGNGTLKLTTRQAFQMHGILKWNMKKNIQEMNEALLDSIAACGDVNRNVMCSPNPNESPIHAEVYEWAKRLSQDLLPQTTAYHEIWLDEEKIVDTTGEEVEPVYGATYLPRKFKIGIAVPPMNDVDVFSQDVGLIAIAEEGKLIGFNVAVGGGMGMTHGDEQTYPQLGRLIGFVPADQVVEVAKHLMMIQRDNGNRSVRKYARFKYTIDSRGLDWLKEELHSRLGRELEALRPYRFDHNGDRYGWAAAANDRWNYTFFIENGRVRDTENYKLMTALREIAEIHTGDFRLSPNQNLVLGDVADANKKNIEEIIAKYNLESPVEQSALRRSSMACVALPTCGLAMAEAERYLPSLITQIEGLMDEAGLGDEEIVTRMTGCPNGCARPAIAELGFIGKGPGKYNMYLGGGFAGQRLSKIYRENIGEKEILDELGPILKRYAKERNDGERFGDFVIRAGFVGETTDGTNFHTV
ncbi:sulfite reductase subunit beta [Sporosarcina sp. P37]|uniref:assimilatory sulfite reductase (NADPH) hemoprotein subunit n=1 Tax=unclassified Sporosarcina TaxID=2647733 RepID=UPI000A17F303|nr:MULTISPECIES: assimilatory sulfite reductase (NADPH) hemoprotein subunit [unclassified Sporosarcina]ARK24264.1 sulfite reductase subunit beta [Sporosarcina sp. P37]PID18459.1 NADPH-dependent assimilatory sulfite reductase hemoprotein subunit [Sporosarcina sp. P35]